LNPTESSTNAETCLRRIDAVRGLPTMPAVLVRLNRMLQDNDVSLADIGRVIETDQAIASKILRLVNSAFYGFDSCISSISHALMILGFNTVRNAAISVAVIDALRFRDVGGDFDASAFWKHSIAVAVAGRHLGARIGLKDPDNAFTAGLLHDIGKLVMFQYLPELFREAWMVSMREGLSFFAAEKRCLPIHHARIGARVAGIWRFPTPLVEAIEHHHEPPILVEDIDLLLSLHLADLAVNHRATDGPSADEVAARFPVQAQFVRDQVETLSEWLPKLDCEIESACRFFLGGQV